MALLERISSVPAMRSSRKLNRFALAWRSSSQLLTATFANRSKMTIVSTTKTPNPRLTRQSSRSSTARIPITSRMLPNTCKMNCEKKLESAITSPSMRSIISPGVWAVWKDISSPSV